MVRLNVQCSMFDSQSQDFFCYRASDMVKKFEELDKEKKGKLTKDEAWNGLKTMRSAMGQPLNDSDIQLLLKPSLGEDDMVDLGNFATLLFRLKLYKPPVKGK